jgi:hypothetical protein
MSLEGFGWIRFVAVSANLRSSFVALDESSQNFLRKT